MQKNTKFLGMLLLAGALGLMVWQSTDQSARMKAWKEQQAKQEAAQKAQAAKASAAATPVKIDDRAPVASAGKSLESSGILEVKPVHAPESEKLYTLENEFLRVNFTSRGGAVRSVELKQYPETKGSAQPYAIRAPELLPFFALNMTSRVEESDLNNYTLVGQTRDTISFARTVASGLTLERRYTLTAPEQGKRTASGYTLRQTLSWHNVGSSDLQLPAFRMNVGVIPPEKSDAENIFLNFGSYDGHEAKFIGLPHFKGGGFLFWSKPPQPTYAQSAAIHWATVKNKFFTMVTTPKSAAQGVVSTILPTGSDKKEESLAGEMSFAGPLVPAGNTVTSEFSSYIGPKEYARLSSLGDHQDEIMQWGWPIFSFFAKLFISMLNGIARFVHNYGVAIIALTLIIRAAMWPFTAAAAQASKKMAVVQPMLKEAQEKYKNSPEKLQKETLRIFQENQVNPVAGCLPALLQIPVFLGFFYMLRSAAELRFESFLWMSDLSMPDTIAHVGSFPINPLPVVMLVTMYFQMKLTPSSGDPEQQKIMQFTPLLFSFLLYNFSAGLTLYWTLSNLVSIVQQLLVNRAPLPPSGGIGSDKESQVIDIKSVTVK